MAVHMDDEEDKEVEFERLREGLIWKEIDDFARSVHAMQSHVDGSSKLSHLYTVSELAGRYADRFFAADEKFEQKYMCIVCRSAGLLHETIEAGKNFEDLVDVADEAVANLVAAVTPDNRLPRPKKVHFLANSYGLAPVPAQLIALADLQHETTGLWNLLKKKDPQTRMIRDRVYELRGLADSLTRLHRVRSASDMIAMLLTDLKDLEQQAMRKR